MTRRVHLEPRHHVIAFAALIALTLLTLGLSFLHLGAGGVVIALAIASIKAAIVAVVFMHLAEHPFSVRATFAAAWLFLVTLLVFSTLDVATRETQPELPPRATPPGQSPLTP